MPNMYTASLNLKSEYGKRLENQIVDMDKVPALWLSECRSLPGHFHQPRGGEVVDAKDWRSVSQVYDAMRGVALWS